MKKVILMVATIATLATAQAASVIDRATDMICGYESFRSAPYLCPGGKLTIGYGCTDPAIVKKGKVTKAEARQWVKDRVVEEEKWVVKTFGSKLSDSQKVALISAAYNIGHAGLCWKTVNGKKVHTNFYNAVVAGNWTKANAELQDWNKSGGKVLAGLTKRRLSEGKLLQRKVV